MELVPRADSFWIISIPIESLCGSPWLARRMRASCTLDSGTDTAPDGLSLNSMPAAVRASMTWPLSRSDSWPYRTV